MQFVSWYYFNPNFILLENGTIVEGNEGNIKSSQYLITVKKHDNPDIETMGHYWEIKELIQTGTHKQII